MILTTAGTDHVGADALDRPERREPPQVQ